MNPTIEKSSDRTQPKLRAKCVRLISQQPVDEEVVRRAKVKLSNKRWQMPENVGKPETSWSNCATQHDRLDVHGGQGNAEFLLSYACAEGEAGRFGRAQNSAR